VRCTLCAPLYAVHTAMATEARRRAWKCAQRGDAGTLRRLLPKMIRPDGCFQKPTLQFLSPLLQVAAVNGHAATVRLLLENKADAHLADMVHPKGGMDATAIQYAVRFGHVDALRAILATFRHPPLTLRQSPSSCWNRDLLEPVQIAARHDQPGTLCVLLQAHACVNRTGNNDMSAVKLAVRHNSAAALRLLLEVKANVHTPSHDPGPSVGQLASDYANATVLALLRDHNVSTLPCRDALPIPSRTFTGYRLGY
jgi:hypothetical protein